MRSKGKGGPIAYWPLGRRTVRGSLCLGHSIWKAEPIPLLPLPFLPWIKSGTHLTAGWTEGVFQPLARVGVEPATFCFAVKCANHSATRLVCKRTTATSFHRQNMCSICANTLEYWSKYTNILNPTVREDRSVVCWQVWQIVRSVLGLKKRHDELSRSAVCWHWPATFGNWYSPYYCGLHEIASQ